MLGKGGYTTTLGDLLFTAITNSDNTANDKLMRSVGGPKAVRNMIAAKNSARSASTTASGRSSRRIAGLIWSQRYSIGNAFYKARDALPSSVRKAAFDRYVADPYDGATPHRSLGHRPAEARRVAVAGLDPRLLSIMRNTKTGAMRVRAA